MMPIILMRTIVLLAVALGWFGVARQARAVRQTSLTAATWWSVWFQLTLTVVAIGSVSQTFLPPGFADQATYLAAVSALCPLIAVLGARRGRVVDWSFFILLPLVVVLEWPALAQWSATSRGKPLDLETPSLVAYGVVLLMGAGNFVFTRFTWPAVLWMSLWGWCVWSLSQRGISRSDTVAIIFCGQLLFWLQVDAAFRHRRTMMGWDRVFCDFRDHFGAVWAFRLMARVNEVAQREQWPWRLMPDGLQPFPGESSTATKSALDHNPNTDPRVAHTFRWLLKQFVDPEWIDSRLADESVNS